MRAVHSHDSTAKLTMQQTTSERDLTSSEPRQQHASVPSVESIGAHERRQVLGPSIRSGLRGTGRAVVRRDVECGGRRSLNRFRWPSCRRQDPAHQSWVYRRTLSNLHHVASLGDELELSSFEVHQIRLPICRLGHELRVVYRIVHGRGVHGPLSTEKSRSRSLSRHRDRRGSPSLSRLSRNLPYEGGVNCWLVRGVYCAMLQYLAYFPDSQRPSLSHS